ncbi:MAG: hypothetical protein ABIJ57_03335 [Pseudomonadota bacterium]
MKCIYPDMITSITASEEDGSFPVANLSDDHPKKVWKGTSRDAVLTVVASAGGALAVIATNATSITVAISSGQTLVWDTGIAWASGITWDTSGDQDTTELSTLPGDTTGALWSQFAAARTGSFSATVTLTAAAGDTIQAGIVRCGTANDYKDPQYGIAEGLVDYSIVKELNNGATYFRKRDVVRTFDFKLLEDRDTDFYEFMLTVSKAMGPTPIAWRIRGTATDNKWIVFARHEQMPKGRHSSPDNSEIFISLIEVL